ncbi:MAG: type II and III secretion system protein family protein [Polyangiales bacterium]
MTRRLVAARSLFAALTALAVGAAVALHAPDAHAQKGKGLAAKDPVEPQELNLAVGENKTIPANNVKNYNEPAGGIVDVKLTTDNKQFVVTGLKPGSASLLLIKENGQEVNWIINVFNRSPAVVESELKQLLEPYGNIRVRRVGARFFLEGSVSTDADVKRVGQIAAVYTGQVESLVGVGGSVDRTNIRIDFFFVQFDKTSSYRFGISYPETLGGPVIQSTFGYDFVAKASTATAAIVNQPLPGLDIAARYGWAKFVKQATVITTNGTDATFSNGGEQNFPIAAGLTGAIQKIEFGTTLTVQPLYDPGSRELEIKLSADVSDLVPPVGATQLPGRQTSKLSTLVHMKLGQSLIVSGIHTENQRHEISGIPGLSAIPIIGVLFGSHSDAKEEIDGAVFIVPSVVEAASGGAQSLIDETMKKFELYDGGDVPDAYDRTPPKPVSLTTKK